MAIGQTPNFPPGVVDHFCIGVEDEKPVVAASLKHADIPFTETKTAFSDVYATDPDGTRIQIYQPGDLNAKTNITKNQKQPTVAGIEPVFQPTGLDHVSVFVSDLSKAEAFYRKLLGAEVRRLSDRVSFKVGTGSLVVRKAPQGEKTGVDHFCVRVAPYNAEAVAKGLQAAGTELKFWNKTDPPYFTDPDGILVQISAKA